MRDVIRSLGVVVLMMAAMSARAQGTDLVQVTVPFAFQAAGQVLPAGDYRFSLDQNSDLVTISGQNVLAMILLSAPGDQVHNQRSFLRFERYGDRWLLHDISFAGTAQQVASAKALKKLTGAQNCSGGKVTVEGAPQRFEPRSPTEKEN